MSLNLALLGRFCCGGANLKVICLQYLNLTAKFINDQNFRINFGARISLINLNFCLEVLNFIKQISFDNL